MTAALRRDDFAERTSYSYQVRAIARNSDLLEPVSLPQVPTQHQAATPTPQLAVVTAQQQPLLAQPPRGAIARPTAGGAAMQPVPRTVLRKTIQPGTRPTVRPFPKQAAAPSWLPMLIMAQRGTFALASVLIAAVLALYSWTVISQQRWTSGYNRLLELQRYEQELMTAIAMLERSLMEGAAQPEAGMKPLTPYDTWEIPAAPVRPLIPTEPETAPHLLERHRPVGY